jgi:hypothetical protein
MAEEDQQQQVPKQEGPTEIPEASQAERDALKRHYVTGDRYRGRNDEIAREYSDLIKRNERVLSRIDQVTYEPEKIEEYAKKIIKIGETMIDNAPACEPLGFAARIASNPGLLSKPELEKISLNTIANAGLAYMALQIPSGSALINRAMKNGVVMCSTGELGIVGGLYESDINTLITAVDLEGDMLQPSKLYVFYEELYHADQVKSSNIISEVKLGEYHRKDIVLWHMGVEANAKIAAALMIMEHTEAGDNSIREKILARGDSEPDSAIFKAVSEAYDKHGLENIRNNPSLLMPAFEAFFSDDGMASSYMELNMMDIEMFRVGTPDEYNKIMAGTKRFTIDQFVENFGQIPGLKGNIFEGRFQSRDDLLQLLPSDSTFKKWLTGEFNFAAEGDTSSAVQLALTPQVTLKTTP